MRYSFESRRRQPVRRHPADIRDGWHRKNARRPMIVMEAEADFAAPAMAVT